MLNFFKKEEKEFLNREELIAKFNELKVKFTRLEGEMKALREDSGLAIQKLGVVRFNPFSDVGSDLSFSVALLDGGNNGVVITSLYNRNENRVYAKPIKSGQSNYTLSEEEKQALEKALG